MKPIFEIIEDLEENYLPHGNDMVWSQVEAWCNLYKRICHRESTDESLKMAEKEIREHYDVILDQFELVEEEQTYTQTRTVMRDKYYD